MCIMANLRMISLVGKGICITQMGKAQKVNLRMESFMDKELKNCQMEQNIRELG